MSKHKKSNKITKSPHHLADVTIHDFANSTICGNRQKKATANVAQAIQKLELVTDKSWDEKDEDFDGDFIEQHNADGTVSYVIEKLETGRYKKTNSCSDEQKLVGNMYPLDIWFLIAEHIRPEDVGRFAGVCKGSYDVVCTAKFWLGLYKRYYKNLTFLPERLQPECLFRKYGVRTAVIRALYFIYPPFVARLKSIVKRDEQHPDLLKKTQCVLMWHKATKRQCLYYFKMKLRTFSDYPHRRREQSNFCPDLLEILDDVYANPDEDCRILMVTCKSFIPIAPVLGLMLTSAQLSLSSCFDAYKLKLGFGSEIQSCAGGAGCGSGTVIILESVINVKVLDWWHPLYPRSYSMEVLLNRDIDK